MNVSLSSELERFVRENVSNGRYRSASEVVRDALRLLQENDQQRRARETTQKARMRELQRELLRPLFDGDLHPGADSNSRHRKRKTRSR
ncbi:MAG: type II toxin-antitoxin system ParD family antitoxin [Bryobacteraceae bacterium]